ncbi:hypothetical protein C1645_824412 [Glomus cerebriforme]|uniref:Uncharacterized protein n=1 Tax=Glomus cerebriforme TaxID=658196 RepID=A0A397T0X7_9GLOM|nr:hypothetical protein C1645_824412 [Glomus cerebriforme]
MSNNRTGCSLHQKHLFPISNSSDQPAHLKHSLASKLILDKYSNFKSQHVYSNRLVNLTKHKSKVIQSSPNASFSSRTLKKQQQRRSRFLNRLLTSEKLSSTPVDNPFFLRRLDTKHHCLLLNKQYVYNHLEDITDIITPTDTSSLLPPTPVLRDSNTIMDPSSQDIPASSNLQTNVKVDDPEPKLSPGQLRRIRIRDERAASNREKKALWLETKAARARTLQDFKSRIKNFLPARPFPLTSMLSASVGFHKKRNFNDEINEECIVAYRLEDSLASSMLYHEELAFILTYFQDEFHACMTESPVDSVTPALTKSHKKWSSKNKYYLTTFKDTNNRFKCNMVRLTKHDRPPVLSVFPLQSPKRPRFMLDDSLDNKRVKLLLE